MIGLMLDNNDPHPLLEPLFKLLRFPAIYFPGWESWDGNAKISLRTWGWYSDFGEVANALFWGFCVGSLYLLGSFVTAKFFNSPNKVLPGRRSG